MKFVKLLIIIVVMAVLSFVLFVAYSYFTDYQPEEKTEVFRSAKLAEPDTQMTYSFVSWNIGYCGLGATMDFFFDGGTRMNDSLERTVKNLENVRSFLKSNDSLDFIFLQEVDFHSKRSYYINEYDSIKKTLFGYKSFYGKNYDVKFVPSPITSPMGRVVSGILSFSKKEPTESIRHALPGRFSFPTYLFMLDRCFLLNRHKLANGKELVVINTHNAAYEDSLVKAEQMTYFKTVLTTEYQKGNYVIVGGDWNQCPPEFSKFAFSKELPEENYGLISIDKNYLPHDWVWAFDRSAPTDRYLNKPYNKTTSAKILIDYFLVSPNVEVLDVKTVNLEFENSDHNPVLCSVRLKQ